MKKLSSNVRFYTAFSQAIFLTGIIILGINYVAFAIPSLLKDYPSFVYIQYCAIVMGNYIIFSFSGTVFNFLKIHEIKRIYSYAEILEQLKLPKKATKASLTDNSKQQNHSLYFVDPSIFTSQEEEQISQLTIYAWFRNVHSQKTLSALTEAILLMFFAVFIYNSIFLWFLAMGFFFFGLAKLHRGYIEVI